MGIRRVSLPPETAEAMLESLSKEQVVSNQVVNQSLDRLSTELSQCETKIDSLLDLALNKTISHEEYLLKKRELLDQKVEIRERIARFQKESAKRFEPVAEFVKEAKQAVFLMKEGNLDS